jgi:hypothetical protein
MLLELKSKQQIHPMARFRFTPGSKQETEIADQAVQIITRAINALDDGNWKEEADDLERDLRTCWNLPELLLTRDDAEDFLARLAANS